MPRSLVPDMIFNVLFQSMVINAFCLLVKGGGLVVRIALVIDTVAMLARMQIRDKDVCMEKYAAGVQGNMLSEACLTVNFASLFGSVVSFFVCTTMVDCLECLDFCRFVCRVGQCVHH